MTLGDFFSPQKGLFSRNPSNICSVTLCTPELPKVAIQLQCTLFVNDLMIAWDDFFKHLNIPAV